MLRTILLFICQSQGAGAGGAIGGITGALIGMGVPEYEAKGYEERVKKGGILLSVHSDSPELTGRAKDISEIIPYR